MAKLNYTRAVETARQYYNSDDADQFYYTIWGGEDIHVGLYQTPDEPIPDASRRTVREIASKISHFPKESRVIDIGAGYGGTGRYLAREFGYDVVCLNLSEVENDRDRQMNKEQGLEDKVKVVDGAFEEIPFPDAQFEIAWSQDAIVHSGDRKRVLAEVDRVLKPGGEFIFTDLMQKPGVDKETLKPVLERIHLDSMGSFEIYQQYAKELGWEVVGIDDLSHQLVNHYSRVHDELVQRDNELDGIVSEEYRERMKQGLQKWVAAGKAGNLAWGIIHFRKPAK